MTSILALHAAHAATGTYYLSLGSTSALSDWLTANVLKLVLFFIGVAIVVGAKKKDHKGAITTGGIVLMGLMVIGMGGGTIATDIGGSLASALSSAIYG